MSLIEIASSGARAMKAHLDAVMMNMANQENKDYSRQQIETSSLGPGTNSGIRAGDGVSIDGIRRICDQFLVSKEWQAGSEESYDREAMQYLQTLEEIFSESSTQSKNSLLARLDAFFNSLINSEEQPDSSINRAEIINQAKVLASRLNYFNQEVNNQKAALANDRKNIVATINNLSTNIANYNQKIIELESTGGNSNTLRDQRDKSVRELSALIEVRVNNANNGSYDISLQNGHPLVTGNTTGEMALTTLPGGGQQIQLKYPGSTSTVNPSCGVQLGAMNDIESNTLIPLQENIQNIAQTIEQKFNAQLQAGYDLNSNQGKPLFHFDSNNPSRILQITDIKAEELGLSATTGTVSDNGNLKKLIALKNEKFPALGNITIKEATDSTINDLARKSANYKSQFEISREALNRANRERISANGVDENQEGPHLVEYQNLYNANLKMIMIAGQLFSSVLEIF